MTPEKKAFSVITLYQTLVSRDFLLANFFFKTTSPGPNGAIRILLNFRGVCIFCRLTDSAVEPAPQGAQTFGWNRSRNIEVSAPAPGSGSELSSI
jgi:hypothetical protein